MNLIENIYPLSPVQQGMLFHTLLAPRAGVYLQQRSCTLHGALNVTQFKNAWEFVLERHGVLRTAFNWEQREEPFQVVYRQVTLPWEEYDWRGLTPSEQTEQMERLLAHDRERGFELTRPPLMRLVLIHVAEDIYRFIWSHHHLLLDGWSLSLVLDEVLTSYERLDGGDSPKSNGRRPYADYIAWLSHQDITRAEAFWRQTLKGFTTPTPLGVDRVYSDTARPYDFRQMHISAEAMSTLRRVARQHRMTVNAFVRGAWALVLSRYSGESDVVFGATVSGRSAALNDIESMVGLFINTVPVRIKVASDESLIPWLKRLQLEQFEAQQYEHISLIQLQAWSEVPRGLPLFESIVVFENAPYDAKLLERKEGLTVEDHLYVEQAHYPLSLVVMPGQRMFIRIIYDRRRFDAVTVDRMLEHLKVLLTRMAEQSEIRIAGMPLLSTSERQQLLSDFNKTEMAYASEKCLHEMFEEQVGRTPEATALVYEEQRVSYRELNERANQLAHELRRRGVGREMVVGLLLERSVEMMVGILGVLKAGGAYLPLDPGYPAERLSYMVADSGAALVVSQRELVARVGAVAAAIVCLDESAAWGESGAEPLERPAVAPNPQNLAYVIYTSGSSGQPKGVQVTHAAPVNLLQALRERVYEGVRLEGVRASLNAAFSFDASVQQWLLLLAGASLYLIPERLRSDGAGLLQYLREQEVEILDCTPSQLRVLLGHGLLDGSGRGPQRLLVAGEAIDSGMWEQLAGQGEGKKIYNIYGPTECCVDASAYEVGAGGWGRPVIGKPLGNYQLYVLDEWQQAVPLGVRGELYLGGVGLARGYRSAAGLTAEKFVPNAFSQEAGTRLYRTGDVGRYLPDGTIEYLGRNDSQVKIDGFRIEPCEIEAILRQHEAVIEATVSAGDHASGEKELIAYLEVVQPAPSDDELRRFLKSSLPEYMLPQSFVILEKLPLTANGKINRAALSSPDASKSESDAAFVAPRTSVEEITVRIWSEVLGIERVGVHDNFFDLGGHSLLAISLLSRVRNEFQIELQLRSIVDAPTPAELAMVIIQHLAEEIDDLQVKQILQELESVEAHQIT